LDTIVFDLKSDFLSKMKVAIFDDDYVLRWWISHTSELDYI